MIHSFSVTIKPRIGQASSLGVGNVDAFSLSAVFHYEELVQVGQLWQPQPRQQELVAGTHFTGNPAQGTMTLLDHPFWQTEGLWRAADREEPLLYKGAVKAPQYIEATFDYYAPARVTVTADKQVLIGDGVDELTFTAECEDSSVATIPLAVYDEAGVKVGTLQVTGGSKVIKSTWTGSYSIQADRDQLDPTWNLPVFGQAIENGSVEVEVV